MDLRKLYEIIEATTIPLRNGERMQRRQQGNLDVVEVFDMPHRNEIVDEGIKKVDLLLMSVGVVNAQKYRDELVEVMSEYPDQERLANGPSYIEVAGVIGDQGHALRLFALGKALGLWDVFTPLNLHIAEDAAIEMAGLGYVMIAPKEVVA